MLFDTTAANRLTNISDTNIMAGVYILEEVPMNAYNNKKHPPHRHLFYIISAHTKNGREVSASTWNSLAFVCVSKLWELHGPYFSAAGVCSHKTKQCVQKYSSAENGVFYSIY